MTAPPAQTAYPSPPAFRYGFPVALIVVAVAAAGFAVVFRMAIAAVLQLLARTADVVAAMQALPWWARLALPALGGLLAGSLARVAARFAKGQGVGDVMEAVVLGRVHLSMRVTLLKSLGSWLAISTGGSIGREGPLIQFGGAIGQLTGDRMRLDPERIRILIAAGAAAGFAAAYNTPFAAILFVLEIVIGVIAIDTVLPVLVATVIATALTRALVGAGPVYGARSFTLQAPAELVAFALLGGVAALVAQLFIRLLSLGQELFQRRRLPLPGRAALGGLLAGGLVAALPQVAGNGFEPLNHLLDGRLSAGFVAWLLMAKLLATTASVSSGSPGGVFTPTMLIGGASGFLFGTGLAALLGTQVGPAGGYALVGMAAATAATTHAPLMAAVMAFELSGDYAIALPLILATAVATGVSRRLAPDSIYGAELAQRGVRWTVTLDGRRILK